MNQSTLSSISIKREDLIVMLTVDGRILTRRCTDEGQAKALYAKYEAEIKHAEGRT